MSSNHPKHQLLYPLHLNGGFLSQSFLVILLYRLDINYILEFVVSPLAHRTGPRYLCP